MRIRRTAAVLLTLFVWSAPPATFADQPALRARPEAVKPVRTFVRDWHQQDRVCVKFADDSGIRLQEGELVGLDAAQKRSLGAALAPFGDGAWASMFPVTKATLDSYRGKAQRSLGKAVADLSTYHEFTVPVGADPGEVIDALNTLSFVELAEPLPTPAPPTVPGDFTGQQGYAGDPPNGTDAFDSWADFGFRGLGVRICDIEYSWNNNHQDLPNVTLIGPAGTDPFGDDSHGTAVLGEMGSLDNGFGTTGMAPDATYFFAPALVGSYNPGAAIIRALDVLGPGDVILIEQQITGPNGGSNFVPIEWFSGYYNAIVTAVGNGVHVVEAAGNGGENLDAPEFQTGNGGHYPFLLENDSGAIIVGAGSSGSRSRLGFSCYGQTVDLQAWGQNVTTLGYGNLYSSEGRDLWYTSSFSGTSSASPIVAASVALVQSAYENLTGGQVLTPAEVRDVLRLTGTPQGGDTSQNIGPLPNVPLAIAEALGDVEALLPLSDDFEMTELDGLLWPIARDATTSTDATNEPSGTRSLKLEPLSGEVLSARLQAALNDDVTVEYAYQQTGGQSSLVVEWLASDGFYRQIAQHDHFDESTAPFQTHTETLPASAAYNGLRIRFRHAFGIPGESQAFVDDVSVTGIPALPSAFSLLNPLDGATGVGTVFVFDWEDADFASTYRVVLDNDEDFSSPILDTSISISTFFTPFGFLQNATQYFWKVEALNVNGATLATPGVATFYTTGFVDACAGDCTGNNTVDFGDLVCMLGRFGSTDEDASADCDESGTVDFGDLVCALGLFGECP